MNQDSFNDFLRQKAGEFQPSPHTPFSAVEARLKQRRRKRFAFWWSAAVLLLGLGGWWMWQAPKAVQSSGANAASEIASIQNHRGDTVPSIFNKEEKENTLGNSKENKAEIQGESQSENGRESQLIHPNVKRKRVNVGVGSSPIKLEAELNALNSNRKKEENVRSNQRENKVIPSELTINYEHSANSSNTNKLEKEGNALLSNKKKEEENSLPHLTPKKWGEAINHADKQEKPEIKAVASSEISENQPSPGMDSASFSATSSAQAAVTSSNVGTTSLDSVENQQVFAAKRNLGMGKGVEAPMEALPSLAKKPHLWSVAVNHSLFVAWNARNLNRSPQLIDALMNRLEGIEDADLARSGQSFHVLAGRKLHIGWSFSTGFGYSKLNFLSITQPSLLPSSVGPSLAGTSNLLHLDINLEQVEWPLLLHWQHRWNRWGLVVSGGVAWNFTFATQQYYYQLTTQSTEVRQTNPDSSIRASVWYGVANAQVQWLLTPRLKLQAGPGIRLAFNRQYAANEAFRFLTIESGLVYEF